MALLKTQRKLKFLKTLQVKIPILIIMPDLFIIQKNHMSNWMNKIKLILKAFKRQKTVRNRNCPLKKYGLESG
jgi:GTP:adenosylcobinamide-phosphate guanylyltransferase